LLEVVGLHNNGQMGPAEIRRCCRASPEVAHQLQRAVDRLGLSACANHRILEVARTRGSRRDPGRPLGRGDSVHGTRPHLQSRTSGRVFAFADQWRYIMSTDNVALCILVHA
jgi:hypothetical protein